MKTNFVGLLCCAWVVTCCAMADEKIADKLVRINKEHAAEYGCKVECHPLYHTLYSVKITLDQRLSNDFGFAHVALIEDKKVIFNLPLLPQIKDGTHTRLTFLADPDAIPNMGVYLFNKHNGHVYCVIELRSLFRETRRATASQR